MIIYFIHNYLLDKYVNSYEAKFTTMYKENDALVYRFRILVNNRLISVQIDSNNDLEKLKDYNQYKSRISLQLMDVEMNRELLELCIWEPFLNLALVPYIDLENYGVGEHEVEVKVTGDDLKLTYTSKTKKVRIKISEKK